MKWLRMNRVFVILILGMIVLAGCSGRTQASTPVQVESEINTSAFNESDAGFDVGEIEQGINESEDIFSDW